jgi:hypothetical protein
MSGGKKRRLTTYLVLRRASQRTWDGRDKAIIVRHTPHTPTLQCGECAVKIKIEVPDEAFEPVLDAPEMAFPVEDVLRATIIKDQK